jgi:hypothetical protein
MSSFGGKVLTGGVLAAIGLVTVKVLIALVSGTMAVFSFLLFTVLPIAVIGWVVLRIIRHLTKDKPAYD